MKQYVSTSSIDVALGSSVIINIQNVGVEPSSTTNPQFPFYYFLSSQESVGTALYVLIAEVDELQEDLGLAPTLEAPMLDGAAVVDVIAVPEWRRCCPNKKTILPRDHWFQNR